MTTVNCLFTNILHNIFSLVSYRFEKTWGRVNDDRFFYFGVNYPFNTAKMIKKIILKDKNVQKNAQELNKCPNINLPQNTSSHLEGAI